MRIGAALLPILAGVACQTTSTGARERMETTADAVWTERVDLRLDERFFADGRGIEIQPTRIDINEAEFFVRIDGLSQTIELHTGPGPLSARTIPPYRFELVSTSIEPSVTLIISRLR